jgi:hypothetical protein
VFLAVTGHSVVGRPDGDLAPQGAAPR